MDTEAAAPSPDLTRRGWRRFFAAGFAALLAGVPALFVVTFAFLGMRITKAAAIEFWQPAAVGFATMFVGLVLSTPLLAGRCQRTPFVLAPHTLLLFVVGAASASLTNCLLQVATDGATDQGASDWCEHFGRPLYWLLLLGTPPALCVGGLGVLVYLWLDRRS